MHCKTCYSDRHNTDECPKDPARDGTRPFYCTFCGSKAHNVQSCLKTELGQYNRRERPEEFAANTSEV